MRDKRVVVQFDVDGVLADFMAAFTRRAKTLGFTDKISHSGDQDKWEQYGDVDPKHVSTVWADIRRDPTFWVNVPPLVDSQTFRWITALQEDVDVYFATARVGVDAKWQTVRWLTHQGVVYPTVVITPNKGETAAALNATHAIDDKAGNAIFTGYFARKTKSYILDRRHNRFDADVTGSPVIRVATVGEFLNDIEKEIRP